MKFQSILSVLLLSASSCEAFQPTLRRAATLSSFARRSSPLIMKDTEVDSFAGAALPYTQKNQVNGDMTDAAAASGAAVAVPAPPATPINYSLIETPADAFHLLAGKGKANADASNLKTLVSAMLGGAYVGMGAMLSLAISGNMGGVTLANPGLSKLAFALLFPVNLLLCIQAGGQLFTGNTASMAAAVCEKKATMKNLVRSWGLSYLGNLISCVGFAFLCKYCGVLSGGAADFAAKTLASKTYMAFGPLIVKAMLCNWLVCLAIYLSFQAKDMTGKYISILLPISTFVAIGFEHSVANMFLLPAGLLCSTGIGVKTALLKNLLPVTLGNAISGSLMVGVMFSFMFGRLGEGK
jgi:formate/nitrite transporter